MKMLVFSHLLINMLIHPMHLVYKLKQVFFKNSFFLMQLPGTRSKLMTLKVILTL